MIRQADVADARRLARGSGCAVRTTVAVHSHVVFGRVSPDALHDETCSTIQLAAVSALLETRSRGSAAPRLRRVSDALAAVHDDGETLVSEARRFPERIGCTEPMGIWRRVASLLPWGS